MLLANRRDHPDLGKFDVGLGGTGGITLTVTLLEAHPRVSVAAHEGGKPAAQQNVIAIGRASPK
ncbi:hypothetical protein [Sorangium sp. So ce1097]|uniref:hypothetical protein n=1 Tax=Sorangium sp. So ce1097 TaxID=3133330 RepID=UPI003F5E9452